MFHDTDIPRLNTIIIFQTIGLLQIVLYKSMINKLETQ